MVLAVSKYREWIDTQNDPPALKAMANAALDAYERISMNGLGDIAELRPLIAAAEQTKMVCWDIGTVFLVRLGAEHQEACNAIRELSTHRSASVRDKIIWALTSNLPNAFIASVVSQALADRSKVVRMQAVKKADSLYLTTLTEQIAAQLAVETDSKVVTAFRFHLAMLTDGYFYDPNGRPNHCLTIRTNRGWTTPPIAADDLDVSRIPDIVMEYKAQPFGAKFGGEP